MLRRSRPPTAPRSPRWTRARRRPTKPTAGQTDDAATVDASAQELDTFNNDVRLRALKTLAEALQPIQQKKAIIYFSSGMQRSGTDNQVELRAAVNAAVRANVAIYPVDSRGLQAIVPGGSARQGSRGGLARVLRPRRRRISSPARRAAGDADDAGVRHRRHGVHRHNDFGEAFATGDQGHLVVLHPRLREHQRDKDGRFRRITVRLRNKSDAQGRGPGGLLRRPRLRPHGERPIAKSCCRNSCRRRFRRPTCRCSSPRAGSGSRRTGTTCRSRSPCPARPCRRREARTRSTLDVAGFIRDERGAPVGRIRDTLTVPPASADGLAARQVLYQTGVTLPPGRFSMKIVVRENATGQMGTFETPIVVPELKQAPVKVSSLVLGTQLQNAAGRKTTSPLVRDGVELVPNLTHIVSRDRSCTSTTRSTSRAGERRAAAANQPAFYRGKVKVFETPVVERTRARCRRSPRGGLPVRGAGRQLQAGPVHLSDQHHRRSGGPLRLPAARAVRALGDDGQRRARGARRTFLDR